MRTRLKSEMVWPLPLLWKANQYINFSTFSLVWLKTREIEEVDRLRIISAISNYIRMYACMYVCICEENPLDNMWMHMYIYLCVFACEYACIYVCVFARVYLCVYVCMYVYVCVNRGNLLDTIWVHIRMRIGFWMCVCVWKCREIEGVGRKGNTKRKYWGTVRDSKREIVDM